MKILLKTYFNLFFVVFFPWPNFEILCFCNVPSTLAYRGWAILKHFADINFRGSSNLDLFAGQTFADLTKIREICESFGP